MTLAEAHRLAQLRLGAQTVARLVQVWPLLAVDDLDRTVNRWLTAAGAVVAVQHRTSASLAVSFLQALRLQQVGTPPPPVPPPTLDPDAVRTSLTITGPVSIKRAATRGVLLPQAADTALSASSAAGMRHALTGGRDTILATTQADPDAKGWQRVTGGGACPYCAGLAGITFNTDATFKAHDGCSCTAVPVF